MLQQQSSSSLQTPKTGRSRFSKALPALPPMEPLDLFSNTTTSSPSVPFSPIPKSTTTAAPAATPTTLRSAYSPFPPTRTPRIVTTETQTSAPDTTKLYSPLPPIPQSSPLVSSFQQPQPQPTRPPAMSIPRRPVGKVEAPPLPAEPPSPSRSVLSFLSAYSRSSGESLMRTSDNDADLSTNSSSEPTLSPTHEKLPEATTEFSLPPRSTSLATKSPGGLGNLTMSSRLPSNSNNDSTPISSPLHLGPLPPIPVKNGRRLPASPRDGLTVGGPAPLVGSTPATPATATIPPTTSSIAPTTTTPTTTSTSSTKPEPIRNPASPQSNTSELLTRRSLKSNQSLDVPELKLTSHNNNNNNNSNNQSNNTSDPDLLITPSFSSNPPLSSSHQNSPARPIQAPFYSPRSQSRNALESLKPLPLQPASEARQQNKEKEEEEEETMGKAASRIKDKLKGLRTDNETLLRVGPKDKGLPSPPSQLQSPISPLNIANTNNVVSPLTPEMPKGILKEQAQPPPEKDVSHTQPQQQQQQQQQNLRQEKQYEPLPPTVSAWKPAAANQLHTARSLPDLKPVSGPQTSSERPPAIAPEHLDNDAAASTQDQPQPQQKFPPRTTSTRNHGLASQKQPQPQQTQQRSRAGTESGDLNDIRPPSLDRRLERVASHPNFATEYGTANVPTPPASQGRQSDGTVYRELIQEDLPEPDPRAMYFPTTQTTQPQPTGPNAVFKPPQLTKAHHGCFQKHTKMIMARNKHYSLACQTCEVEDNELRWQCAWCRLRVCGTCMRLLQTYQRDLGRVLEHIKNPPPTPPASQQQAEGAQRVSGSQGGSRPGSAEALAAVVEEAAEGAGQVQVQGQAQGPPQGTRQSQGQDQQVLQQPQQPQQHQQFYAYDGRGYGQPQGYGQDMYYGQQPRGPMLRQQQSIQDMRQ